MSTEARMQAKRIFGDCGDVIHRKEGWRCGFSSWYGFHTRGSGDNAWQAVADAEKSRLSDDPTPTNPSWVPGSYTDHYSPFVVKLEAGAMAGRGT